jgi:hypothetical protein
MTYEQFLKVILTLQKQSRVISNLYDNNVDLTNFVDPYHKIITILITEIYGKEGLDWFDWFCNENEFGHKGLGAHDENGNPICHNHESLWEYLEKHKKDF